MRTNIKRGAEEYSPHLITLLSNRLDNCQAVLDELKASIPKLCEALSPEYEKLVSILRSMAAVNTRCNVSWLPCLCLHEVGLTVLQFPASEVKAFQDELKKMQATMVDGKFVNTDGTIPENQDVVVKLLDRCLRWAEIVLERWALINSAYA